MADTTAVLSLIAGAAGLLLTQVGTLIPARRDFVSQVRLKSATCLETLAASHCFLLKQSQSVGLEEFDNVMRGDGRTARDHFSEYAQTLLSSNRNHVALLRMQDWFRAFHAILLASIIALIVLGLSIAIFGNWFAASSITAGVLFAVELVSLIGLYAIGSNAEKTE